MTTFIAHQEEIVIFGIGSTPKTAREDAKKWVDPECDVSSLTVHEASNALAKYLSTDDFDPQSFHVESDPVTGQKIAMTREEAGF